MKSLILTNEYPPYVYGGAGVHVTYLARELARLMEVEVRCFGDQKISEGNLHVRGFESDTQGFGCPQELYSIFTAARQDVAMGAAGTDADLVHVHTWYTHLGGILMKLNYGIPLILTVHSLEPLRPWKKEQLGRGYDFSLWIEKTAMEMADAIIAVSQDTKADILRLFDIDARSVHVIHNGIDLSEYRAEDKPEILEKNGIDPARPFILFVGRITRQKGIIHLVRSLHYLNPDIQVVLCAGAPDTPEIAEEMKEAVAEIQEERSGVVWIEQMLPRSEIIPLYSMADLFVCPSIYEPFGITNLEAMACGTPVVGSAVGGIPEVVVHGETGILVPIERMDAAPFEPIDPEKFSFDLASAINELMGDKEKRKAMGNASRKRVEAEFGWDAIARKTAELYRKVCADKAS